MKKKKENHTIVQLKLFQNVEETLILAKTGFTEQQFKEIYGDMENAKLIQSFKKGEEISNTTLDEFLGLKLPEKKEIEENIQPTKKTNTMTKKKEVTNSIEKIEETEPTAEELAVLEGKVIKKNSSLKQKISEIALLLPENLRKKMEETKGTTKIDFEIKGISLRISHFQEIWKIQKENLRIGWEPIELNETIGKENPIILVELLKKELPKIKLTII